MDNLQELEEKLAVLLEQYKQVEAALAADPKNDELLLAKKELSEVITMTEDLYNLKRNEEEERNPDTSTTTEQQNLQFPVGTKVEAVYAADGRWYPAVIIAHTPEGTYKVRFLGYGNEEEVKPEDTREKEQKKKKEEKPEASKKRSREDDDGKPLKIPDSLKILPNDSEEAEGIGKGEKLEETDVAVFRPEEDEEDGVLHRDEEREHLQITRFPERQGWSYWIGFWYDSLPQFGRHWCKEEAEAGASGDITGKINAYLLQGT